MPKQHYYRMDGSSQTIIYLDQNFKSNSVCLSASHTSLQSTSSIITKINSELKLEVLKNDITFPTQLSFYP